MPNYTKPTEIQPTLLLTLDEVAHELRVSRRYVEQMIARSELREVRFGGCVRVRRSVLQEFIDSLDNGNPPGAGTDVA